MPLTLSPPLDEPRICRGSPAFRRTNLALFAAGWTTFALVYCAQPLMPIFTGIFGVSAAQSSLVVSLTTGVMAISLLIMGSVSDRLGRKGLMSLSLALSALLTILMALSPDFQILLVLRAFLGLAISGVPAVAMAYLSEEMDPASLGFAMGLYIAGSALGGMSGRLVTAAIADFTSWRIAIGSVGGLGLIATYLFWKSLPDSRFFQARPLHLATHLSQIWGHLTDAGLPWLFASAFLLMGSFVTLYNYVGFRLLAPPFSLSQAQIGVIFSVYLAGIVSSGWAGNLADRYGRRRVFWLFVTLFWGGILLSLSDRLTMVVVAIALATFGFFGAHSIASSWIGRRARTAKAQASSLYLFFYYMGSSLVGTFSGTVWSHAGWPGIVILLSILLALALGIALRLSLLKPLAV